MQSRPCIIYNASAGSGKTYALVKAYLRIVLSSPEKDYFKHLLAITFTNKAVAEMKVRIVNSLVEFGDPTKDKKENSMFLSLCDDLQLNAAEIESRSQRILKHLLHHYSQFSVETIDHFNYRLIRTFSHDLNLPSNFEIKLEGQELIAESVDQLIDKAGENPEITELLLAYALYKTDEDKSWDISLDLNKVAKLLLKENDRKHLQSLKNKTLKDFKELKKQLESKLTLFQTEMITAAAEAQENIHSRQLDRAHFSNGYLYDFFNNIHSGNFSFNWDANWHQSLGEKPLYPSRVSAQEAASIDSITSGLIESFNFIIHSLRQFQLHENLLKNIVPLTSIHAVNEELQLIKSEQNILPIHEFNALIHEEIKDQPVPFIYERLGDKFRHFFIDEFQDTSELQWSNLIPLIDNALSQEYFNGSHGSLLLVGDAKQSIYRWRGGLPEQFMQLYDGQSPFSISEENISVQNLDTNFRSYSEIIHFNNHFFTELASYFENPHHTQLYELGNAQQTTNKSGGYVQVELLESTEEESDDTMYARKTLETINELLQLGFDAQDICVLTRKKKEGVAISEFLLENEVPVVSEETLLLQQSEYVQGLVLTLQLSSRPDNEQIKAEWLQFIFRHLELDKPLHDYLMEHLNGPLSDFAEHLSSYGVDFSWDVIHQLPLYEACEYIAKSLGLNKDDDAFLPGFMDLVFRFSVKQRAGITEFLAHWETEKEKASVNASNNSNAVQIMTIHKAKGLEFPVVIFPYADLKIYQEMDAMAWYPYEDEEFTELLIGYNKGVRNYGPEGADIYRERQSTLELDNLNLLYVALTRAIQHLYIFGKNTKVIEKPNSYNSFLKNYLYSLTGDKNSTLLERGNSTFIVSDDASGGNNVRASSFPISLLDENNIRFVATDYSDDTSQRSEALRMGNLVHDTMASIINRDDMENALSELRIKLLEDLETYDKVNSMINDIVAHPDLFDLFETGSEVFNEKDIISPFGVLRPDRVNLKGKKAIILDYKTGAPSLTHEEQINGYAAALKDMGFEIEKKLLVYTNNEGILINKV